MERPTILNWDIVSIIRVIILFLLTLAGFIIVDKSGYEDWIMMIMMNWWQCYYDFETMTFTPTIMVIKKKWCSQKAFYFSGCSASVFFRFKFEFQNPVKFSPGTAHNSPSGNFNFLTENTTLLASDISPLAAINPAHLCLEICPWAVTRVTRDRLGGGGK
jgi:hypothetical protein